MVVHHGEGCSDVWFATRILQGVYYSYVKMLPAQLWGTGAPEQSSGEQSSGAEECSSWHGPVPHL